MRRKASLKFCYTHAHFYHVLHLAIESIFMGLTSNLNMPYNFILQMSLAWLSMFLRDKRV